MLLSSTPSSLYPLLILNCSFPHSPSHSISRKVESLPLEKRLSFAESNIICGNESLVDEVMSDVETLALDGYESDTRESIVGGTPLPGPIFELLKSPFKDNNAILKTSKSRLEEQSAQREITTERFRELKKIFAQVALSLQTFPTC